MIRLGCQATGADPGRRTRSCRDPARMELGFRAYKLTHTCCTAGHPLRARTPQGRGLREGARAPT